MLEKDGIICLDPHGDLPSKGTVLLDTHTKSLSFDSACQAFLDTLKEQLSATTRDNLITLCTYDYKPEFQELICNQLLGLRFHGCFMESTCYSIPESLTVAELPLTYEGVHALIRRKK